MSGVSNMMDAEVIELHRKLVLYHMRTAYGAATKDDQTYHLDLARRLATEAHAISDRTGLPIQCALSCDRCQAVISEQPTKPVEVTLEELFGPRR